MEVRVLVVGDYAVGKTTFCNLLANGKVKKKAKSTIGCNTHILFHQFKGNNCTVELLDLGGRSMYAEARKIFYNNFDGVMLVHDMSNNVSYKNLTSNWIKQIYGDDFKWDNGRIVNSNSQGLEIIGSKAQSPVLIIGNKYDLINTKNHTTNESERNSIFISSLNADSISQNSIEYLKINDFFSRLVVAKYYPDQYATNLKTPPRRSKPDIRYDFSDSPV